MRTLKLFAALLMLGFAFTVQAQKEEKPIVTDMKRPKDIKMQSLDSWKNSVFDLYDDMMTEKSNAEADSSYDPAENIKVSAAEIVVLAGKSVLMLKEAKAAGKLKQARSIPVIAKCKKALSQCKRYANSVLGDGAVEIEEEGKK